MRVGFQLLCLFRIKRAFYLKQMKNDLSFFVIPGNSFILQLFTFFI
jgi:hypothetical protein